jgi:DNA-binding LacI/PurR family transcriptional regulator
VSEKKIHTMKGFADAIGLSRPTVSRYFNDIQSVRKSTRKTIEIGLEKFSYRPNFHASNLSRRKSRAIGIIVPSIIDPFYAQLVSTIEIHAEESGYFTILQSSYHDPKMEKIALRRLKSMNLAGIAMAALGSSTDTDLIDEIQASTPIVFVDSRLMEDIPYFGTNNRQSIAMMVDYLCGSGSAPAFVGLPPLNTNTVERQDVYFTRMKKLGYVPSLMNPDPIPVRDNFERFGFEQFMMLPREKMPKGTTILCVNDRVAFGVIAAASKLGLKVGKHPDDDLRVAGHDNQHFSQYTTPSLTTVAQDTNRIGMLALQALLKNDRENDQIADGQLIDGTILFRDSA